MFFVYIEGNFKIAEEIGLRFLELLLRERGIELAYGLYMRVRRLCKNGRTVFHNMTCAKAG